MTPPKPSATAPIERQPTAPSEPSQPPIPTGLYPAPLFSAPSAAHQANTSKPLSTTQYSMTLEQTQQREEYLIAHYTSVFEVLEAKYLEIGNKFMDTVRGSFEEEVLKGVMDSLRAAMRENENLLQEARKELWTAFEVGSIEGGVERIDWPRE